MKRLAALTTAALAFGTSLLAIYGGNSVVATDIWRFGIAGAISSVSFGAVLMQSTNGLAGENAELRKLLADSQKQLKSLQTELDRLEAWRTDAVAEAEATRANGAS